MNETKRRPIEERIAEMFCVGSYRDPRDGLAMSSLNIDKSRVAAALGSVVQEHGPLCAMVMETHYGGTLMHDDAICREWDALCRNVERQDAQTKTLSRLACTLSVRELAGRKYASREMEKFAWMIAMRRQGLEAAKHIVGSWLDDYLHTGVSALCKTLGLRRT